MSVTLLILAAGMGSRYGGLKQLDEFGPNGETLMELSVYDAIRAGFDKVVFVIRRDFEQEFRDYFFTRLQGHIKTDYVFQELHQLPKGYEVPEERKKPWGTAHAVMCARPVIHEPFAVLNADDFYGLAAIKGLYEYLENDRSNQPKSYAVVGYPIAKTLSEHGTVSRAVIETDSRNRVKKLTERYEIYKESDGEIVFKDDGTKRRLTGSERVSLNLMGFYPKVFGQLEEQFIAFLDSMENPPKDEFGLPIVLNTFLAEQDQTVEMIESNSDWFGVTYSEDKSLVKNKIEQLFHAGEYPEHGLWKK